MTLKTFKLAATVSSVSLDNLRASVKRVLGSKAKIASTDDGLKIEAVINGESARDLNRQLLSEMRRVEKRTRLRAEWTSCGVTERFFDYMPKGTENAEE